jgi:DNA-binding LacI/PurR family transcriptional regulator
MSKMNKELARKPLYRQVEEAIRKEILAGKKPGETLAPEPELAKQFSVSLVTVRQALAELAKAKLIVRQRGRRTCVAERPLARKHVGVLLETDIATPGLAPYYLKFFQELRLALDKVGLRNRPYLGFRLQDIALRGLQCQDLIDDLNFNRISGIVRVGAENCDATLEMYAERGIPYLDQRLFEEGRPDSTATILIRNALRYFKERNRTRLAILAWDDPSNSKDPAFSELLKKEAVAFGFDLDPRWMDFQAKATLKGMGWERFRDLWLAQENKPDALIVWDDTLFPDCQTAMLNMGVQVPRDLDVVAFRSDAVEFDLAYPVYVGCTNLSELALRHAQKMKQLIEGGECDSHGGFPITWKMEGETGPGLSLPDHSEKATFLSQ